MKNNKMKVTLYGKSLQETCFTVIQQVIDILATHCSWVYVYQPFYESIKNDFNFPANFRATNSEGVEKDTDYVFSIGGDGTFLDALTLVKDSGIPMFGINIGRLGFLSSVNIHTLEQSIIDIKNKNFHIEKRMLLHCEPTIGNDINWALNDISIQRNNNSGMISISVSINGEFLNTYWCDGLIIATPTGSTAYSLGCGGPIIMPMVDAIVLTPIASHMLTVRPLVIPADSLIEIKAASRAATHVVSLDSNSYTVNTGTTLTISKEKFHINLICLSHQTFSKTLREKLMWGFDKRN
ncbi:MAG TPA: NAD kinase [Bacteroidales bacterium]|jgi:NAD+ kinase|nr:NAD kinase [Bacteroidales bacterium]HOF15339.1 NAD kinase [Bacteroidales bacterium]HOR81103.1 NAD kinase [Bacteroidales bacterium]HPJ90775.1 NAD kinase [Bacteroidales bacterium]HQB19965.1 NAD kinase [Bacteroidales bacterium]